MTGRVSILRADARALPLPDASVDLILTSPPYFNLRAYEDGGQVYPGQLGGEQTPTQYLDALIACTREWMRVLKPTGSLWLNLGDKYAGNVTNHSRCAARESTPVIWAKVKQQGMPHKSLMGMPWRYAIRCIDELGLILRAEVVWSKPSSLPESVTDRVRRSHETWFHLVQQPRYFSAVDTIREPSNSANIRPQDHRGDQSANAAARRAAGHATVGHPGRPLEFHPLGKLPGSVWDIATEPLRIPQILGVQHFASFPTALPRRIIAGWSPTGICTGCGEGRRSVAAKVELDMSRPQSRRAHELATRAQLTDRHLAALRAAGISDTGRGAATQHGTGKNTPEVHALAAEARAALGAYAREYLLRRPTTLLERCACPDITAPTRPARVLDPCGGTGTTVLVAAALGRHGISIDMSHDYGRVAKWRTSDPAQRAKVLAVPSPPVELPGQLALPIEVTP